MYLSFYFYVIHKYTAFMSHCFQVERNLEIIRLQIEILKLCAVQNIEMTWTWTSCHPPCEWL